VATEGTGITDLVAAIAQHRAYLQSSGDWERRERTRLQTELENLLKETLVTRWRERVSDEQYRAFLESVFTRELGPIEAVNKLLGDKF
jgi:LAO/AO transport system kinase